MKMRHADETESGEQAQEQQRAVFYGLIYWIAHLSQGFLIISSAKMEAATQDGSQ